MAEVIRMPEVLAGASEAAIQTWLVGEGAAVEVNQGLAEIETDKAIVELSAEVAGTIGRLLVAEGSSVSVGEPILVLLAEAESMDAVGPALAAAGASSVDASPQTVPEPTPAATTTPPPAAPSPPVEPDAAAVTPVADRQAPSGTSGRLFASPLVRRLAEDEGVALTDIPGSGPNGRIVRRDLERHLSAIKDASSAPDVSAGASGSSTNAPKSISTQTADFEDVPLSRMRKAIARRLTESKSTVPHFYLVADCRVDALLALRAKVNENATRKISVNDFVLKAVAGALADVPAANAIWNGDSIRRFSAVDISVAVATEGGLTTPVLRNVERLPLGVISSTVAELASRAREGRLKQHELEGGSFSVSNLGMYGTGQFSAILNPPQSGILAVGAARAMPVVGSDGALEVGQVMTVTLSADHRVLDGAVAAEWLAAFQRRIENPLSNLL